MIGLFSCILNEKRWYGWWRVLAIYSLTGVASYIANSLIRSGMVVALGASGGVCGIVGAIMAEGILNWDSLNHPWIQLGTCI